MTRASLWLAAWVALGAFACGGKTRDPADAGSEGEGGGEGEGEGEIDECLAMGNCFPSWQCVHGSCVTGNCDEECTRGVCCRTELDGRVHQGCVDLLTQPFNCGACGVVCESPWTCEGGYCVCPVDMCDGQCVGLHADPANCGECGHECPAETPLCYAAECVTCEEHDLANCGESRCVDTTFDDRNCGACGSSCPEGSQCLWGECVAGNCDLSCPEVCCDGSCTDLTEDLRNCGACGNACEEEDECWEAFCHGGPVP